MKRTCRHCHEDLSHVPPTAAMTRHITGLCAPSRNEVDTALLEIEETEKKRTRRAIEAANEQRRPVVVTGKGMLKLLGAIGLGSAFLYYLLFIWPTMGWAVEWVRSVLQ